MTSPPPEKVSGSGDSAVMQHLPASAAGHVETPTDVSPPINAVYGALTVGGLFIALFLLERWVPLRRARAATSRRLLVNLLISALALGTALVIVKPAVEGAMQTTETAPVGLLQWIELPPVLAFIAALLLLDLTFYWWHFANHRVPLLWRFHIVHHVDPDLDVSTAFRFHLGEMALSAGFRVVQILLIGASPLTVVIYELVFQAATLFHHSNVRLPIRFERALIHLIVTPRMHGIHHSMVQRENTSNFSVVFPFWDRLFRTLMLNVPQQQIVVGIPAYEEGPNNRLAVLLALPFRRQPDPWRRPNGTRVTQPESIDDTTETLLSA